MANTRSGVYRLADLIGSPDTHGSPDGRMWYRAVPLPFCGNRLRAAWSVLTGRAYAIQWPELGELEKALRRGGDA